MRFTFFIFILFVIATACSPVFHQQKHTRFGHVKGLRFSAAEHLEEEKSSVEKTIEIEPISNTVAKSPKEDSAFICKTKPVEAEIVALQEQRGMDLAIENLAEPQTADSMDILHYLETLKDERNSNIILSGLFFIILGLSLLNGFLPAIILLSTLLLICVLVMLLKQHRYSKILASTKTGKPLPERYKNPKDKARFSRDWRRSMKILTLLAVIISGVTLAIAFLFSLLTLIINGITFGWLLIPMCVIAALLIFSVVAGRNYNRGQKLRGLETDRDVITINVLNWCMIILLAITTCLTFLYHFLRDFG